MRFKQLFTTILFCSYCLTSIGQKVDIPIAAWKNHFPFNSFNSLTQSDSKIFATSELAVIAIEKTAPFEKTFISKLNGLSSASTKFVKYIPGNDGLVVVYDDSSFDLLFANQTLNYDNIKNDGSFFNREVLQVARLKSDVIYFCTAFGLVEFFPLTQEFGFTLDLGAPVFGITYLDNKFYASTEDGILVAEDSPSINLKDIANWSLLVDGFPPNYQPKHIVSFNDQIIFSTDSLVYRINEFGAEVINTQSGYTSMYVTAEGEHLLLGWWCNLGCDGKTEIMDAEFNIVEFSPSCVDRPRYAIEDQYGQVWASDSWMSMRRAKVDEPNNCDKYVADGPIRKEVYEIAIRGDEIWCTSNSISATTYAPTVHSWGVLSRTENGWTEYRAAGTEGLSGQDGIAYHRVVADPETNNLYVGTNSDGMLIIDAENNFSFISHENSVLDFGADPGRVRVAGIAVDELGNVWMANNTATNPIVVRTPDGNTINNFSNQVPIGSALREVVIDQAGYKWFSVDKNGLLVYDDNGTLNTSADDRVRLIKTTNSLLPENRIRSLAVDLDGEVWVGTELGVVSFNCGSGVFDAGLCQGFRQIVEVDGFRANLLETEDVRTIAVDGANRKWFGTTNGVFLMSPNGKEQLAFFNTENSPLPDNFINDINIHPESGEVFIATGKGLVSIRAEATIGTPFHVEENAYAFPNPVRPDYRGPIAIKGLTRDADIKITDVNGQLVYAGTALGGQAIWDGRDYNGKRASSGVYYVFSTSESGLDSPNTLITKLLFIN